MNFDSKKIGQRINELLALNGKKQKELAEHLGVAQNIISYFIKGTRTPNTKQIFQIATFFDTPADYLLGLTDCKKIDTDLQGVCDYTGLSEDAIECIKSIAEEEKYAFYLNMLLSSSEFREIMAIIDIIDVNALFIDIFFKKYPNVVLAGWNKNFDALWKDRFFIADWLQGDMEYDKRKYLDLLDAQDATRYIEAVHFMSAKLGEMHRTLSRFVKKTISLDDREYENHKQGAEENVNK